MKCILCLTLTAVLGLGGLGAAGLVEGREAPATVEPSCELVCAELPANCPMECGPAECGSDGTCVVRCERGDGTVCELTLERRGDQCVVVECKPLDGGDCEPDAESGCAPGLCR